MAKTAKTSPKRGVIKRVATKPHPMWDGTPVGEASPTFNPAPKDTPRRAKRKKVKR